MKEEVWKEIETLYQEFERLNIRENVDYEKYYLYSLITHSTAIEGSTLTEAETQLLFDEGVTAGGKPLVYHLMNEDLKNAYDHARAEAKQNTRVTPIFFTRIERHGDEKYGRRAPRGGRRFRRLEGTISPLRRDGEDRWPLVHELPESACHDGGIMPAIRDATQGGHEQGSTIRTQFQGSP